jgi:imidazolonepropionase-like amidohydrolase
MRICTYPVALLFFASLWPLYAQQPALSKTVQQFVRVNAPKVVLTHVRVIDGTGKAAIEDQNIVIENGKITDVRAGTDVASAAGTAVVDLHGYSVIPGLVGMHDHLFYVAHPNLDSGYNFEPPDLLPQMTFSAPRLYLAAGVTTARTTGSVETYTDLNLKHAIDSGKVPGPHFDVTGPYLDGADSWLIQAHELADAEEARQMVNYWADRGVTSFKAYTHITRAELKAAIDAAHERGLKITGHLCSVTYKEAADLGIDDLEHGFVMNTQLDPDKMPDRCSASLGNYTLQHMKADGLDAKDLFETLIRHHVAVTSTLPLLEDLIPGRPPLRQAILDAMSPEAREAYLYARVNPWTPPLTGLDATQLYKRELELERAFAVAGGLLLAGPDPTGDGGIIPGFGDQREIELLVEAGFSPLEGDQDWHVEWGNLHGKGSKDRIDCHRKKCGPCGH